MVAPPGCERGETLAGQLHCPVAVVPGERSISLDMRQVNRGFGVSLLAIEFDSHRIVDGHQLPMNNG